MPTRSLPFPKGFFWGTSTSAYQIEGAVIEDGRGPSIWDTFAHQPGRIAGGQTADIACDHYHRWKEDVDLLRRIGVNAYRFSISWPRVFPDGRGRLNGRGLDFYDRLVDRLLEKGIEPFPTLYHWDLPERLQEQGGWPARQTVEAFEGYARAVGERLGDRVHWWITHNEPYWAAKGGYFRGDFAPGIQDPAAALQAGHHLLLSHARAMRALRETARGPARVGIALSLQAVEPATSSPADLEAAGRFDALTNRWFLDPILRGAYPADLSERMAPFGPRVEGGDLAEIGAPIDFLGVNYYSRALVRHNPSTPILEASQVRPEQGEFSLMWEVYPQGLPDLLERLWREYRPRQLIVTENGMPLQDAPDAGGKVRDPARISYLRRHLAGVQRVLSSGVPVGGYFVWSLLDNFEWALGYKMRFGLVYVDFDTQRRILKESARWYRRVIRGGALEALA